MGQDRWTAWLFSAVQHVIFCKADDCRRGSIIFMDRGVVHAFLTLQGTRGWFGATLSPYASAGGAGLACIRGYMHRASFANTFSLPEPELPNHRNIQDDHGLLVKRRPGESSLPVTLQLKSLHSSRRTETRIHIGLKREWILVLNVERPIVCYIRKSSVELPVSRIRPMFTRLLNRYRSRISSYLVSHRNRWIQLLYADRWSIAYIIYLKSPENAILPFESKSPSKAQETPEVGLSSTA
jgi:hypothetical protein